MFRMMRGPATHKWSCLSDLISRLLHLGVQACCPPLWRPRRTPCVLSNLGLYSVPFYSSQHLSYQCHRTGSPHFIKLQRVTARAVQHSVLLFDSLCGNYFPFLRHKVPWMTTMQHSAPLIRMPLTAVSNSVSHWSVCQYINCLSFNAQIYNKK